MCAKVWVPCVSPPQVSSWGVFPRPSNISAAYGGGRTIKPGELYEDPKVTEERVRQSREALARYKRKVGGSWVINCFLQPLGFLYAVFLAVRE